MPAVWPEKLQQEWSTSAQPDAKRPRRSSLDFGLSLTSTISVETTWTASDIAKAGGLLTIPPRSVSFEDEEEMRRVYSLIYDVFRYKSVLQQALMDTAFFILYPQFQKQPNLVWLLFYDLYKRRFLPRDHHDEQVRVQLFEESGLLEADVLLWSLRVKLAASVARLRIKNNALRLSQLLPPHLRDERVIALDEAPVTGWINAFKIEVEEVKRLVEKAGLSPLNPKLQKMDIYGYEFDKVCPKFIKFHPSQRSDLAQSTLVRRHHIILQDRAFCLGPSMICNILIELDLAGNVVQTHINSPRTMAYLANILVDNEKIDNLIAFGAGERKEEYEEYLRELGVTNTEVHAEKFVDISSESEILENVVAVLATPPNTYSGVIDPVDLVCSRGGDLSMLEVLTDTEIGGGSLERVNSIMEEQRQTLRMSMSRPQIQVVLYETHSIVSAENSEMVTQLVNEMNNGAREKHAEEQGKPLPSPSFISTSSKKEGSDIGHFVAGGDTTIPSTNSIISVEIVDKDTKDSERTALEMDIQVPHCDLFELSALPDQSPEDEVCVTMEKEGCYLAYLRRKEIVRLNAKYMINIAESRGLFGGEGSGSKEGKKSAGRQHRKKSELQRSGSASPPLIRPRSRRKVEVDRIAAPTQASILRRATDPGKRGLGSLQDSSGLLQPVFFSDQHATDILSETTYQSKYMSPVVSSTCLSKVSYVGSEDSQGKRHPKRQTKLPKDQTAIINRLTTPTKTSLNRQVSHKKVYQKASMMSKSSKDSVSELIEDNIRSRVNLSIIDVFYGNEGSPNTSRVTHNGRHSMTYAISETSRRKENMDISLSTVELPRDTKNPSQIKQNENPEKIPCIEAEIIDANQLETENVERKLTEAGRLKTRKTSLYNSTIASQGKQNKKLVEVSRHVSGFNTDTTSEDTNNYFNSDITSEKTKHIDLVHEHQKVGCIVADAEKQKLYESPNLKQYHQRLQFLEKVREKLKLLVSKPTTSSNKVVSDTKIESYSIPSKKCIRREQMIIKSFKNLKSRMSESKSELKKVTDVVESNHKVCELRIPDAVKTLVGTKINDQESEEIKLKPSIADNKNDRDNIDEPTTETLWETSNTQTRTPSQHDFTVSTPNLYLSQLNTNVENKFESACNTKHAHERNRETSEIEKHLHRYPHAKRYKEEYVDKYLNQEILNYKKCKSSGRKYAVGERLLKIRELTSKLDTFHERMNARHMNAVQRLNKIKKTFSIDNIQDILGQAFNKMEEFTHTIITDNKSHKLNTEGGREVNVTEKSEISHPIQEKCMDVNTHKRIFDKTLVTQNMINTTQNIGKSKGIDVAKLHSFNLTQESQNKTKGKEKQSAEIVEIKENSEEIKHFTSLNLSSGTENLIKESGGVTVQNLLQKLAKKQFKDYRRESLKKLQSDMLSAWSKMNNENTSGSEILEMGNYIKDKNRNIYNREKANFKTDIQTECYISSHEDYKSVKENEGRPKAKSFQNKNLSNNESKDRRKSFDSTKFMKTTQSGKLFFESSSLNTMVPLRMDAKQMFTPSKEKYASKANKSNKFGCKISEMEPELQTQFKVNDKFMEISETKCEFSKTRLKSSGTSHLPKEGQPSSSKLRFRPNSKSTSNYKRPSNSLMGQNNKTIASSSFRLDQKIKRADVTQKLKDKHSRYKRSNPDVARSRPISRK